MNRRSNGIVIETASQRKVPRVEGKVWAGIPNPYTRYAELQGEEDGHVCYIHIPYKYKRITQLEAAGFKVVEVFGKEC